MHFGDDPQRRLAGGNAPDVGVAVVETLAEAVHGRAGAVRRQRHVGQGEQRVGRVRRFLRQGIEPGGQDAALPEGVEQRRLVHHLAAAGVDQNRLGLHAGQRLGVDHVPRIVIEGHVQAYHVGGFQQGFQRHVAHAEAFFLRRAAPEGVVIDDAGVEGPDALGHLLADVAQADEPDRLAGQFVHIDRARDAAVPLAGDHVLVQGGQLAVHGQNKHDGVLGHCNRIGAAVRAHRHPRRSRPGDVDLIVPGAQHLYQLEPRRRRERLVRQMPHKAQQVLRLTHGGRDLSLRRTNRQVLQAEPLGRHVARQCHDVGRHLDTLREYDRFLHHVPRSCRFGFAIRNSRCRLIGCRLKVATLP